MLAAAVGMLGGLATRWRWPMTDLSRLDLSLAGDPGPEPADLGDDPPTGLAPVSVEYVIDADDVDELLRSRGCCSRATAHGSVAVGPVPAAATRSTITT